MLNTRSTQRVQMKALPFLPFQLCCPKSLLCHFRIASERVKNVVCSFIPRVQGNKPYTLLPPVLGHTAVAALELVQAAMGVPFTRLPPVLGCTAVAALDLFQPATGVPPGLAALS